ncbi:MAG: ABC transporter ATP-binding protein [Sphingomonadales bacterium]|nr:ABC transporter ATP-binding protein [Sphingomonadales bacterium]
MIRLDNVWKTYPTRKGPVTVLRDIDLHLERGQKIGILGGNGSGKSTLIRIVSGIEQPTSGTVTTDMRLSWPLAFSGAFQGSLTGLDNMRFICRIYGKEFDEAIDFVEDFTQLGRYLKEPLKVYSSGMRARLAFSISMMIEFDCYLLDEVFAVGDIRFQQRCHDELFVKRKDRAFVIVSHDSHYIREHCDRGCVLDRGVLTHYASVEDAQIAHSEHMRLPL